MEEQNMMKALTTSKTTVTGRELARICGVNEGTISKLSKKGDLPREPDGSYNLWTSVRLMIEREGEEAHPEERPLRMRLLEARTQREELAVVIRRTLRDIYGLTAVEI
jgi:hypothetical protein